MDSRYLQDKEELKQSAQSVDEDRRAFLTAGLVGGAVAAGTLVAGVAHAQQVAQAPALTDKPWWPHPKWGKDDSGRRLELDHAGQGSRHRQADQGRQDLPHRPRLRIGHAQVRRARLHPAHSRQRRPAARSAPTS